MSKILLMHYFGGAGGKFITNCLAYSGQVAFPNYAIALEYQQTQNLANINQSMLATIPSRENSREWLDKEQGCYQLFGRGITNVQSGQLTFQNIFYNLGPLADMWLPIKSHRKTVFDNVCQHFRDQRIFKVLLTATPDFIDFSIRLKWPKQHHCLDLDQLNEFNQELQTMSFDYAINDWDPRDIAQHYKIKDLATALGIEYDPALAKEYTTSYINFHHV